MASGSAPGILYGLPKVHKVDFSTKFQFRPIFAAYSNPCFKLAKFLVSHLSHLTRSDYTTDNSYSFVTSLKQFDNNANNLYMTSFDIESLYTNIPLIETIEIILSQLFSNPSGTFLGLSRKLFKSMLEICVLNSYFIFNNKLYRQVEGLGMGLPLAPTFANIFLAHHEKYWLNDCPVNFAPVFYKRYMDDTFILFEDPSHAPLFLQYLNNRHSNINFTIEVETGGSLPFLDILISRDNISFVSSVYRKQTFTGLGTSFFSFCEFRFKFNSIFTLLHRAYSIASSYQLFHDEVQYLISYFFNNGYPKHLILSCIKKFLCKKYDNSPDATTDNCAKLFFSLPYYGKQSQKLKIELTELLTSYFSDFKFNIVLINNNTIGKNFPYKDRLPLRMRSSIVYEWCCPRDCGSGYVGSTSRNLLSRASEHAGVSFRTRRPLASPPFSNIREHAEVCGAPVNISDFSIIGSCQNVINLRILESLHIHKSKPSLNSSSSSYPLLILNP